MYKRRFRNYGIDKKIFNAFFPTVIAAPFSVVMNIIRRGAEIIKWHRKSFGKIREILRGLFVGQFANESKKSISEHAITKASKYFFFFFSICIRIEKYSKLYSPASPKVEQIFKANNLLIIKFTDINMINSIF